MSTPPCIRMSPISTTAHPLWPTQITRTPTKIMLFPLPLLLQQTFTKRQLRTKGRQQTWEGSVRRVIGNRVPFRLEISTSTKLVESALQYLPQMHQMLPWSSSLSTKIIWIYFTSRTISWTRLIVKLRRIRLVCSRRQPPARFHLKVNLSWESSIRWWNRIRWWLPIQIRRPIVTKINICKLQQIRRHTITFKISSCAKIIPP